METQDEKNGKRTLARLRGLPLFILLGLILIAMAFFVVVYGDHLLNGETETTEEGVLNSIPEISDFPTSEVIVAEIPQDTSGIPQVGDLAPNFPATDLDGNPVNLADFAGRPVIVNFWATWCAPCLIEMPELQTAHEKFEDEGLAVLAVNREEDAETVRTYFYDQLGLTFTPLLDQEAVAANMYGVFNMPTTYFVNAEGQVTAIHRGPMTLSQIEGYLAETIPPSG